MTEERDPRLGERARSLWARFRSAYPSPPPQRGDGERSSHTAGSLLAMFVAVFTLSCCPALIMAVAVGQQVWKPSLEVGVAASRIALSLPALALVWFAIIAAFGAVVRAARARVFGASPVPRLLAAAVTFAIYPTVFRSAVVDFVWAATRLGLAIPLDVADFSKTGLLAPVAAQQSTQAVGAAAAKGAVVDGAFMARALIEFLESWRTSLWLLGQEMLQKVSISEIIAAVATWAVLSLALCALAQWKVIGRVGTFLAARPHFNASNGGFVVLLVGGLYLSLAAISSLPRLRETHQPNAEVSADSLEKVLAELQLPPEQIQRYLPDDVKSDPFGDPPDPGAALQAPAPPAALPVAHDADADTEERRWYAQYLGSLAMDQAKDWPSLKASWADLVKNGTSLADAITTAENQDLAKAVAFYRAQNLDRQGSREEIAHYLLIQDWYAKNVENHRQRLQACTGLIRRVKLAFGRWSVEARDLGTEAARAAAGVADLPLLRQRALARFSVPARPEFAFYDTSEEGRDRCNIPGSPELPPQPSLGESLGALRFIGGWLLNVGSLPLALIIGMMGFGILGSVISTFVKERARAEQSDTPEAFVFISDLMGVVLRGLSAAIVVFLAVQGGLAVLSGAGSEPNPYVLLLVCFVAAVFSERVWLKAYDYFIVRLDGIAQAREAAQSDAASARSEASAREARDRSSEPPIPMPGE